MNLFSRMSEILNDVDESTLSPTGPSRRQVDQLVRAMELNLARVQQSAVGVIAAERAIDRELSNQLHRQQPSKVLVERLREVHDHARVRKSAVKEMLREMYEGLEQARQFRNMMLGCRGVDEGAGLVKWRRAFWQSYHRICDLLDKRMDHAQSRETVP